MDSFAKNNTPERRFGHAFTDALDVLIVDNRPYNAGADWEAFLGSVGEVFVKVRGFSSPQTLLQEERKAAVEGGELLMPKLRRQAGVGQDGEAVYSKEEQGLSPRETFREIV